MSIGSLPSWWFFKAFINCPNWFSMFLMEAFEFTFTIPEFTWTTKIFLPLTTFSQQVVASYFVLGLGILEVLGLELEVCVHQAWFPPIKNLNGSSNLDYRCWNRGCSNSSYNCLWSFLSLYARDIAPMDDYFHRNRTTKLALLVHWLKFYFSDSISACLMLPSMLIRH